MRLYRGSLESRRWLQDLLFYMVEQRQQDYCFTFHNVELIAVSEPFATLNGQPLIAAVTLDETTDRISLLMHYPTIKQLPPAAQIEILQHEAIHIIDGHLSSYGNRLQEEYGSVAGIAMDCYVNQKISTAALEAAGLTPVTIQRYGLPPGLSSEDYCRLLKQNLMNKGQAPSPDDVVLILENGSRVDSRGRPVPDGTGDGRANEASGPERQGETPRPFDVMVLDKEQAAAADNATVAVIAAVQEALKSIDSSMSRGFGGADQKELIRALKRAPSVPWSYYLRQMETSCRADFVVPTRHRLSRRVPEFYMGRVRRYGLDVVFMIDTSGSMGEQQLQLVEPELRGIHARGARITVIHCDAAVAKVEEYSPYRSLAEFHGRGGTEYSDALLHVRQLRPRPGIFVGFTDGYGGIERYAEVIRRERGEAWYAHLCESHPPASPDGIMTLWLIPEGCMAIEDFQRTVVPFGQAVIVPAPGKDQT